PAPVCCSTWCFAPFLAVHECLVATIYETIMLFVILFTIMPNVKSGGTGRNTQILLCLVRFLPYSIRSYLNMSEIPRSEYPRPQCVRPDWLCLNGEWQFEIDQGDSGLERGLKDRDLNDTIIVPFCPESKLSGVENLDFLNAVWYRRSVTIPQAWAG